MNKRKIILFIVLILSACILLCGCTYKRHYFEKSELGDYTSPYIFLESEENGERYFFDLAEPKERFLLDYEKICDFAPNKNTFLFVQEKKGMESICEYDLEQKQYTYLVDEKYVIEHLDLENDDEFQAVYYYPEEEKISFYYETFLCIYEVDSKDITKLELPVEHSTNVYGWLNDKEFLYSDFETIYKVNIMSGDTQEISRELGTELVISEDGTTGVSHGNEDWMGMSFSPVLVWDTHDYKVKKYHEADVSPARIQLSRDKEFIMFGQSNRILCMKTDDESICVIFETDEVIKDILWRG